jgi:Predicted membrane protein (DUF2231)
VLLLAAVSWLLRLSDPAAAVLPWGLALSAVTVGLLLVTGWTGGELAYRHMVGVTGHGGHEPTHAGEEHTATGERPHAHDGRSHPAQPPAPAGSHEAAAPSHQPGAHQGTP